MKTIFALFTFLIFTQITFATDLPAVYKIKGIAKDASNTVVSNRYSNPGALRICISKHFKIFNKKEKLKYEIAGSDCRSVETDGYGNFNLEFVTGLPSHKKNEFVKGAGTYIYGQHIYDEDGESTHMTLHILEGSFDDQGGSIVAEFEID